MVACEMGVGEGVQKGEGIKRHKLLVISHREVMYSRRKIVNNIIMTLYGGREVLDVTW